MHAPTLFEDILDRARRMRKLLLPLAFLACSPCVPQTPAAPGTIGLRLDVRARRIAPGEPLRLLVVAPRPLRSLTGVFLGEPIALSRAAEPSAVDAREQEGTPETWSGWSLVPLDQSPGVQGVEVSGTTARGRSVAASLAVTIEAKEFPEERLDVAPRYVEPPPELRQRLQRERDELAAIYRGREPGPTLDRPFVRPVPGGPTSIFGMRRLYNGEPRSPHPGLDLRAASGTAVAAAGDGRVVLAEELYYSGNTVILDHGGGLFTLYAHLSEIFVKVGDRTRAGQRIGLSGATGRVTGPHLHWGAKIGNRPFDPTALLDPALFR